jgi:hypothetical protein
MSDTQLNKREEDIQRLIIGGVSIRIIINYSSAIWEERTVPNI